MKHHKYRGVKGEPGNFGRGPNDVAQLLISAFCVSSLFSFLSMCFASGVLGILPDFFVFKRNYGSFLMRAWVVLSNVIKI